VKSTRNPATFIIPQISIFFVTITSALLILRAMTQLHQEDSMPVLITMRTKENDEQKDDGTDRDMLDPD
jgi:hypothetical protein